MRHRVYGRKLGRRTNHRIAMWRNQAVSLFTHGQITTTVPKAKALQPFVERLITIAKKGDLHARRRVLAKLGQNHLLITGDEDPNIERNRYGEITHEARKKAPRVITKLFSEIAPAFADRQGGYTRIIRLQKHRIGDGADLCVIMLVGSEEAADAPQVTGQYSRRREVANKRMAFAAKLRKGGTDEKAQAPAAETAEAPETPVAPEENSKA